MSSPNLAPNTNVDVGVIVIDPPSRDGDLSSTSPTAAQAPPFYSFSLEQSEAATMRLPQRLDLGVGDSGIIGRRVSVMTGSRTGPLTIAEGIIGWN